MEVAPFNGGKGKKLYGVFDPDIAVFDSGDDFL